MKKIYSFILAAVLVANLNAQTTYTFSNCGATGQFGPTQAQVTAAYSSTTLAGLVTINTQGIQQWTVPSTANYQLTIAGAGAQSAGGRVVQLNYYLTQGSVLKILVGQLGVTTYPAQGSGGGGGSFVAFNNNVIIGIGGGAGGFTNGTVADPASNGNGGNGGKNHRKNVRRSLGNC